MESNLTMIIYEVRTVISTSTKLQMKSSGFILVIIDIPPSHHIHTYVPSSEEPSLDDFVG